MYIISSYFDLPMGTSDKRQPEAPEALAPTVKMDAIGAEGTATTAQMSTEAIQAALTAGTTGKAEATMAATSEPAAIAGLPDELTFAESPDEPTTPDLINPLALKISATTKSGEILTPRHASYLVVDSATITNPAYTQIILKELLTIVDSRDFITTNDHNGNFVIFALSERGGVEKLFDIEESIRAAIPETKMLISEGTISRTTEEITLIDTDLQTDLEAILGSAPAMTVISSELTKKIADKNSRVGSNTKLITADHENPKLAKLIKAISLVSQELGGPDRLIGYDKELQALLDAAVDDETHIISLEGKAGMGKSRIRTELLTKLPNHILCSMNPSDHGSQGSGLVTLSKQLGVILEQTKESAKTPLPDLEPVSYQEVVSIDENGNSIHENHAITLKEFNQKPHGDRIEFATKHPETISELCYQSMQLLRSQQGPKTLMVLEDLHHADRFSESYIVNILKRYANLDNGEPGKVLLTSRPEEMRQSRALKDLKKEAAGKNSLKVIALHGLDFIRDDKLAHDFAFYSLPVEVRQDQHGKARKLGTWYRKLAMKAKISPWYMKNYIDQAKKNTFAGKDNSIEVKPEVLERIERINPDDEKDQAVYFQERLAVLPENGRVFLQYIALMAEKLNAWQAIQILTKIMGLTKDDLITFTSTLGEDGYLSDDKLRYEYCKLQHEDTRAIVLASIPEARKPQMAKNLCELFKNDDSVEPKIKHDLATIIARAMTPKEAVDMKKREFWGEYEKLSNELFQDTDKRFDIESAYGLAKSILDLPAAKDCITTLKINRFTHTQELAHTCIKALFQLAENGRLAGKFAESTEALNALKAIYDKFPHLVDILEVQLIVFEKACMQHDVAEIKRAHTAIVESGAGIPLEKHCIIDILLANFEERYDDALKIYESNKVLLQETAMQYTKAHLAPSPLHLEIRRICEAKIPYTKIVSNEDKKAGDREYDEDVIMHPGAFTTEHLAKLQEIQTVLSRIESTRRSHPLGFDPWSELKIIEQQAGLQACLGQHDEAVDTFSESFRIAIQMGMHDAAARIAKLKGDTLMTRALLLPESEQEKKVAILRKAIETYGNEGIETSLSNVSADSEYQFILRLERLWAISTLALELGKQDRLMEDTDIKTELERLFATAMADFKFMHTEEWTKMATDPGNKHYGYIHFYFMGHMGHILQIANARDINLGEEDFYDEKQFPYMNLSRIENAQAFGGYLTDLNIGKVQTTLDGLNIMAKALRRRQNAKFNENRQTRDSKLQRATDTPRTPKDAPRVLRQIGLGDSTEAVVEERPEYDEVFIAKQADIKRISHQLSDADSASAQIMSAMAIFSEITKDYPQFTNQPEILYQIMGYIGHIIHAAFESNIILDNSFFDPASYPQMKIPLIEQAYEFAQRVTDQEGEAEFKSEGLFALLTILQEKDHHKKKAQRRAKDATVLAKRKAA